MKIRRARLPPPEEYYKLYTVETSARARPAQPQSSIPRAAGPRARAWARVLWIFICRERKEFKLVNALYTVGSERDAGLQCLFYERGGEIWAHASLERWGGIEPTNFDITFIGIRKMLQYWSSIYFLLYSLCRDLYSSLLKVINSVWKNYNR